MSIESKTYIDIVKLWKSWNVISETDYDLRLDNHKILFAYNSGKIENPSITYNDTREVFANGKVLNFTGDPGTLFDIQNQKLCYEMLKPKLAEKEPLSLALVKDTHEAMMGGSYTTRLYVELGERPGKFKMHDFEVGLEGVGSLPEEVEGQMSELINEMETSTEEGILTAAAYFHSKFEHIHPFADGNGRVGRVLLNYFLMINNHPPVIIYEVDKHEYYDALNKYDTSEDIMPMRRLLEQQLCKTWEKTLERAERRKDKNEVQV
ncbi:MAG: Fic family protein [Oscillospiraceae bacterium]|nr:Fic family protein [Oscillospiraceae bacterium]MCL2277992.1 Fic family protein [Oscillospiraceae bacterium]